MAIFASTTTSGYSDPLKAYSIKALEQRQKDLQAQQAAQQPDTALAATIPGGIGNVLGIIGDKMNTARSENAVAEGRNELAGVIAQGPKGPDGQYSPEQMAVLARRSPDFMEKLSQNQHDLRFQGNQIGSTERVATADRGSRESIATGDRASRESVAKLQEDASSGRTAATLANKSSEGALDRTAASEAQESKQEQEIRVARLNSDLARAQKDRDNAFASGQTDKVQQHETDITRLKSELASGEARQSERFQASQLNTRLASDEKTQELQRAAVAANLERQIAANSGDKAAQQKADEKLARIAGDINTQRDLIKQGFEAQQQANQIKSTEKMAADELTAKKAVLDQKRLDDASDPQTLQRKADAEKKLAQETSLVAELDSAHDAFKKGIFTGPEAGFETGKANLPFIGPYLGDRDKASRTTQVNNAMEKVATGAMSTMLKGATTDFELKKFITLWNDPRISYAAKVAQFERVLENSKADRASQAEAVKKMGGTDRSGAIGNPNAAAGAPAAAAPAAAAGPARPEGKDDGALISEARAAILKGKNPEAVKQQLNAWGVKGAL